MTKRPHGRSPISSISRPRVRPQPRQSMVQRPDGLTGLPPATDTRYLRFEEFAKRCSRPGWKMGAGASLFNDQTNNAVGTEKFRTLRSRLYQIAAAHQLKKIVITSGMPGEGKTFVTTNLAQSFVRQTDRRILLIDADLRASRLHMLLGAPDRPGLTDYLCGDADEFQVTQVGPSGNLCLIPGGTGGHKSQRTAVQ